MTILGRRSHFVGDENPMELNRFADSLPLHGHFGSTQMGYACLATLGKVRLPEEIAEKLTLVERVERGA